MLGTTALGPIEKGSIPVKTTEAYADRIRVPLGLPPTASLEERIARLRAIVIEEAATYVDTLPSVRLKASELASFRATLGGDVEEESALQSLLLYKEELPPFIDFLFLLRAEVHAALPAGAPLAQAEVDETVLQILTPWASRYGYAGIRRIVDRDTAAVFTASVQRGELQYDYFFRGQLFEIAAAPGHNIHGHFPHVLQWLYYSWRHDRAHPRATGTNESVARIYRKVPLVEECELFRRLSDTFNSSVQLQLTPGSPPNFPAMAVNYRGFPRAMTDPASVTRLFELVLYNSLDPARPVLLEPMQIMVVRPDREAVLALFQPETADEVREWDERRSRAGIALGK
jgi:hypothetical protein